MITPHFTAIFRALLCALSLALCLSLCPQSSYATPDQWWEDYILSPDPEAWLKSLPDAQEDTTFFTILHAQVNRSLKAAATLLAQAERDQHHHGQVSQLARRQMLLNLTDQSAESAWQALIKISGVSLNTTPYQPPRRGAQKRENAEASAQRLKEAQLTIEELQRAEHDRLTDALPSMPTLTTRGALRALAQAQWRRGDRDSDQSRLRSLLSDLDIPPRDVAQLLKELPSSEWSNFTMLLGGLSDLQIQELIRVPGVNNSTHDMLLNLLIKRVSRVNEAHFDPYQLAVSELDAYFDQLIEVSRLFKGDRQSFKAHLLIAQLVAAERRGTWPLQPLLAYLKLPQNYDHYDVIYRRSLVNTHHEVSEPYIDRYQHPTWIVGSEIQGYESATGLTLTQPPSVIIARHIEHHLKSYRDLRQFKDFLDEDLLYKMWAKMHILSGQSLTHERVKKYLKTDDYQKLTQLKMLDFAPYLERHFKRDQDVSLSLRVKGYDALNVKIYMLNTAAYLKTYRAPIPLKVDLSGLQANHERELKLDTRGVLLQAPTLLLKELSAAGSYIVDIQAGDQKIRAMIQKGTLTPYLVDSQTGPELMIIDDLGAVAQGVEITVDGRAYPAESSGRYRLPYQAEGGTSELLMTQGDLSVRQSITLPSERYELELTAAAPQLRGGDQTQLQLRARLTLNGTPISLKLLRDLNLSIKVTSADGTPQAWTINAPKFDAIGALTQPILLPMAFHDLSLSLTGTLKSMTQGEDLKLSSAPVNFERNSDLISVNVADVIFAQGLASPYLQVIGRNGEPLPDVTVTLSLKHAEYHAQFNFTKRSDHQGRVTLPQDLSAFSTLSAQIKVEKSDRARRHTWTLTDSSTENIDAFTARAGETLRFMWSGSSEVYLSDARTLREVKGSLSIENGIAQIRGLKAGHYELIDVTQQTSRPLRVFAASDQLRDGLWFTPHGVYPHTPPRRQILAPLTIVGDELHVSVTNSSAHAQMHLVASPYALDQHILAPLSALTLPERPSVTFALPISAYGVGQVLSEEMRYIIERQVSGVQVGNLSPAPSLLINRADQGVASSEDQPMGMGMGLAGIGGGKSGYGRGRVRARSAKMKRRRGRNSRRRSGDRVDESLRTWDFLARGALVSWSTPLFKDHRGSIPAQHTQRIPLKALRGMGRIHVVVTDGVESSYRSLDLPTSAEGIAQATARRDLRTATSELSSTSLDIIKREQRALKSGDRITLPDLKSRWKSYETLKSVYQLYERLLPQASLSRLKRLLTWPSLDASQKWSLYGEIASAEVDFFIYHKDPAFFKRHIAPLLAQKGYASFLERWMMGQDLDAYLAPHAFAQLNLLEQILLLKKRGRTAKDQARLARYVEQRLAARPVPKSRLQMLFQAALAPSLKSDKPITSLLKPQSARPSGSGLSIILGADSGAAAPDAEMLEAIAPAPAMAQEREEEIIAARERAPRLFRGEGATHQWIERRYYDQVTPSPSLISMNQFWLDFALYDPQQGPFLSPHFPEAATHFSAAWLALALLDLPFEGELPTMTASKGKLSLDARSPGLYFYEGVTPQALPAAQSVSIRREYWSINGRVDRVEESGLKEYRVGIPYMVKLMIMNPTTERVEYELSHPIPDGAIALISDQSGLIPPIQHLTLKPYQIKVTGYAFYFPDVGEYKHAPAYVTQAGQLVGASEVSTLKVVSELTQLNQESWQDVARLGTHEEVLTFLKTHNPRKVNLRAIDARLTDAGFYRALVTLLDELKIYDKRIWSYALMHRDIQHAQVWISMNAHLRQHLGPYSELQRAQGRALVLDNYDQLSDQHYDFDPLTVARAHSRGKVDAITHPKMKDRYLKLLKYLAYKPRSAWTLYDHLGLTYYLIRQGRLTDALAAFKGAQAAQKRQGGDARSQMYFAYLDAYLKVSRGAIDEARAAARPYRDIAHPEWKERFKGILSPAMLGVESQTQKSETSSTSNATLPQSLEVKLEGARLVMDTHHVSEVEVRLYPINLEVLFSNNPTSLEGGEVDVSPLVKPSYARSVKTDTDGSTSFELPEAWRDQALQVEVRAGGLSRVHSYAPQSFKQHIFKQRGLLRITDNTRQARALSGVYLKVYVKLKNGTVRFYKDGYTDYRGIFDYVNANPAPPLNSIKTFMILTLTKTHGAMTRSVSPPAH